MKLYLVDLEPIEKRYTKQWQEWIPKLMADDSVDSIPADEDELIALIVARDDYKNRTESDNA